MMKSEQEKLKKFYPGVIVPNSKYTNNLNTSKFKNNVLSLNQLLDEHFGGCTVEEIQELLLKEYPERFI